MKQIEDRKKVVAAIYLNSMANNKAAASSVEAREKHSRRRQSDGD